MNQKYLKNKHENKMAIMNKDGLKEPNAGTCEQTL
jgi:hypothetical protein